MAEFIGRYPILNFSGGVRRDKSSFELQINELADARNVEFTENGRVRSRLGSQQLGQTLTGDIENSFYLAYNFLVNNNSATASIWRLIRSGRLNADVAIGDTEIFSEGISGSTVFPTNGTIEIDGDLITYSSLGANSFKGVTGITFAHSTGAAVHQWKTVSTNGTLDGQIGLSYAVLGAFLFVNGRNAQMRWYSTDLSTVSNVTSPPGSTFLDNYRDRLYCAGDGISVFGNSNWQPNRVSFSARGDGKTWTTSSDYFDLEDQIGDPITGFKVYNDYLGIFKINSTWTYDEIELKVRLTNIGAYTHKVVQPLGKNLITFCPQGIFETNLFSARQIGEPVREYWENFVPQYDGFNGINRIITNTFAWVYKDRYFLWIGNITKPVVASGVVLEYNSTTNSWTVHTSGYENLIHATSVDAFRFGDAPLVGLPAVFAGDTNGQVWRLYENKYRNGNSDIVGGDIYVDRRSNLGTAIPAQIETPLYDFGQPNLWKSPGNLRVYTEQGQWTVEYRVENAEGLISSYCPLGTVSETNQSLSMPKEAAGYRIGLRLSSVNENNDTILNGFVFEKIALRKMD